MTTSDEFEILYGEPSPGPDDDERRARLFGVAPPAIDEGRASWHARQATANHLRAAEVRALFDAEIERLQERREATAGPLERSAEWHWSAVQAWHRREEAAGRVGKTVTFPVGGSKLRKIPDRVEVTDEEALRAWLEAERPDAIPTVIKTTEKVLVSEAVKLGEIRVLGPEEPGARLRVVTEDGEEIPGLAGRVAGDSWNPKT